MIAAKTVDATLRRIGQNVALRAAWRIFSAMLEFFGKRLARGFVFYEFDAEE